jgi:hypothetical protein
MNFTEGMNPFDGLPGAERLCVLDDPRPLREELLHAGGIACNSCGCGKNEEEEKQSSAVTEKKPVTTPGPGEYQKVPEVRGTPGFAEWYKDEYPSNAK